MAAEANLKVETGAYSLEDLRVADEAFLTGTFGAQTPVSEIDGRPIGDANLGPVTQRLEEVFLAAVKGVEHARV